jgi:very-short-patch-repair endonuclease
MIHLYNNLGLKTKRRLLRQSQTDAENKLWQMLRNQQMDGIKFFRQYSIGRYIVDFYCPSVRLAIEVDGGQHLESEADFLRTNDLRQDNIIVLRFWNNDALANPKGVYEEIRSAVQSRL